MRRRDFIQRLGAGALALGSVPRDLSTFGPGTQPVTAAELAADVAIIGGGTGGVACALAAAGNGLRVILTEETDWIGGQFTAQAVPPDEHPWIESFGATLAYRRFRERIRDYYFRNYAVTAMARKVAYFNPGNGDVSRLCHEPRVSLAVLHETLAPFISGGRLTILLRHKAVAADVEGDRVRAVSVRSLASGRTVTIHASYFVDATELGDLLPLTKTEFVTGSESRAETGEPHATAQAEPANQQSFTFCFAMDYLEGEDHVIEKPKEYEFWKEFVPPLTPPWAGRLLSWEWSDPQRLEPRKGFMNPTGTLREPGAYDLWLYRRIADRRNFLEGTYASDITLVNWPQNDYMLGNLVGVTEEEASRNLERAKQLSLSLLYWLQTEAPRPDGGAGWRGLRLRSDIVGTEDGLAKYAYIRESRRIKAEFTVLEQHVGTETRMKSTGRNLDEVRAAPFPDSVGVGSYRIDLHPSTSGRNSIDISSLPFEIPLGALLPQRVENLLPACKNIGTTHITNGCYRLHPPEWNIGESVGALAAFCLARKAEPRQVRKQPKLLADFQNAIQAQGIEIHWPKMTPR